MSNPALATMIRLGIDHPEQIGDALVAEAEERARFHAEARRPGTYEVISDTPTARILRKVAAGAPSPQRQKVAPDRVAGIEPARHLNEEL